MDILHIDAQIIVVNKPAGLAVLPEGWDKAAPYLVSMLESQFADTPADHDHAIWVVHRLDKNTSGVIVFARTAEAHRSLSMQFEQHSAEKIYHAVLIGLPAWDEKTARHPLRLNVGHKHRTAVDPRHGKPSETTFRVMKRYKSHTLVEAHLMTGRTHQIRVHAYALGYPLLGDDLYGTSQSELIHRPALHSSSLTLENPLTEQRETYAAPYPEDFARLLKRLSA